MALNSSILAAVAATVMMIPVSFAAGSHEGVLEGKWKDNRCEYTEQYDKGYVKRTYKFDTEEGEAVLKTKIYSDDECTEKRFEYRIYADLETKVTNKKKSKGTFKVTYTNQTLRPMTKAVARKFKQDKVCGLTKWKLKRELDVNGKSCLGMSVPKVGHFHKGKYNANRAGDRVKITFSNVNGEDHVVELDKAD